MQAVLRLKELGFDINLNPGNGVQYSFKGKAEPNRNEVMLLLQEIKEKKAEAMDYLRKEEVYRALNEALSELRAKGEVWDRLFPYIATYKPELSQAINAGQEKIDSFWKEGRSIEEIKEAILEWKRFNMEAFRLLNLEVKNERK